MNKDEWKLLIFTFEMYGGLFVGLLLIFLAFFKGYLLLTLFANIEFLVAFFGWKWRNQIKAKIIVKDDGKKTRGILI